MSEQNNQPEQLPEAKNIYQAMACVMADIEAIGKDKRNEQQNFNYRGIDDIYNVIHPILSKYGIFTAPEVLEQSRTERTTNKNGKVSVLAFVNIKVKYTFWCKDGSHLDCVVAGEGMDSGDKATAKAMSIAHKYALLQTFSIPTAELIDQEADTYGDITPLFNEDEFNSKLEKANTAENLRELWTDTNNTLKNIGDSTTWNRLKVLISDKQKSISEQEQAN
ncbi:ERF family protein [Entomomonas asaccharolytica]|uniref:ERF family protein n=1 Tax=Entomomonas asaccharolytica TaxID=2785331 RepID=A0A974NHW5_9GAMM|nr:ERF family protein [Entomomonas asaccharolytica]QQP86905.1 ERF family protein [Entomomonas asaccharolytica]